MENSDQEFIKKCENKKILYNLTSERFQYEDMSYTAEEEIKEAKLKQRSDFELEKWEECNYYEDDWCSQILKMLDYSIQSPLSVSYENYNELSIEEFQEKYERLNKPLIINNGTTHWGASKTWTFNNLYKRFKDANVKVGEDDEGFRIKIKFKYFLEYIIYNKDDSPLYLFESSFEKNKQLKELMKDYEVPKYFKEDLFDLIEEGRRPPHRWFLVGPERSGTSIHIDPLGTSAWNASMAGYKFWLLLPPETPSRIVKGKEFIEEGEDDEAIMFIRNIFPRIKKRYAEEIKEMVFIQKPGDIVFVPGGWWHVVVNLTDTIAVTQNFCNSINFTKIWTLVRKERKKMAVKFLKSLKHNKPEIYSIALMLNENDNYTMMTKEQYYLSQKIKINKTKGNMSSSLSNTDSDSSSSSSSSLNTDDFDY